MCQLTIDRRVCGLMLRITRQCESAKGLVRQISKPCLDDDIHR
jgi:hypothetical protein